MYSDVKKKIIKAISDKDIDMLEDTIREIFNKGFEEGYDTCKLDIELSR